MFTLEKYLEHVEKDLEKDRDNVELQERAAMLRRIVERRNA